MRKKISVFLMTVTLAFSFASSQLLAKENNSKDSLVALGDSIPFGYNLENNNNHASKEAYPALIGEAADLRVRNLGEPGWTTTDLLYALENDQKFRQAVRHADYITLSIGNNDLLRTFNTLEAQAALENFFVNPGFTSYGELQSALEIQVLLGNLNQIIEEIRELSDAEIIFYNIYNPFVTFNSSFYNPGNLLLNGSSGLPGINTLISNALISNENVTVVDAFKSFNDPDNLNYLINQDIHPTPLGHQVLADIGYQAIVH